MHTQVLFVLSFIILLSSSLYADEVYLNNGDRLTGKIESLVDGKLTLKTDFAGVVTIDSANIQTFSSVEPIAMHLKDGTVVHQKISRAQGSNVAIEETQTLKAQEFNVADINAINPPVKPAPKWEGDISAGLAVSSGNTSRESSAGAANLKKRTEDDRTTLGAAFGKSKEEDPDTGEKETTEDWWKVSGVYDYFFTKKFFGFVNGSYQKDSIAELDRRVILGGGLGYQWIESEKMNFATRAGLASVYEKYENNTDSSSEVSAQLGYDFDMKLRENIKFMHSLTYYPSLEQVSDYFLTTNTEIRADLTKRTFTNFRVIFDHDSTPANGQGSTDVKYIAGVGATF